MLEWLTSELEKYRYRPLEIDQAVDLTADLKARDEEIIDLSPIQIKGTVSLDGPFIFSDLHVQAKMTYPSTRSLVPVDLPLDFMIHEAYTNDESKLTPEQIEAQEIIIDLEDNKLNLDKAIADNILLNIPTQVLTEDEATTGAMPQGKQWSVVSEEDYERHQDEDQGAINSQFAKLKELFPDSDED